MKDAVRSKYKIVFNCTAPCCLTLAPGLTPSPQQFTWAAGLKEDNKTNVLAVCSLLEGMHVGTTRTCFAHEVHVQLLFCLPPSSLHAHPLA